MNNAKGIRIAQADIHPAHDAAAAAMPAPNTASRAYANRASTVVSRACVTRRASSRARYSSVGAKNRVVQKGDERRQRLEDLQQLGIEARAQRELRRVLAKAEE